MERGVRGTVETDLCGEEASGVQEGVCVCVCTHTHSSTPKDGSSSTHNVGRKDKTHFHLTSFKRWREKTKH